uniref:Uncharacterized protein n=1 Tax=viral metagenome TaxID=1070528 RepID=A0A6C0B4F1_9ZZZZ
MDPKFKYIYNIYITKSNLNKFDNKIFFLNKDISVYINNEFL